MSVTRSFEVTAALAAGGGHSLEIRADGTLHGWGANASGQLGDGSTMTRPTPVPVSLPAGVSALSVAAGGVHSLVLGSDGELYAWGDNSHGQIGDGSTVQRTTPVQVSLPAGVSALAIAAGYVHSLAIGSDGKLYAWGKNDFGQLGDGSVQQRTTPVQVSLPAGVSVVRFATGFDHSLAVGSDRQVFAWGHNSHGQLGNGVLRNSAVPLSVNSAQTISFAALPDLPLSADTITVRAHASSGLPVSFDSWTRQVCTVSGNTVTLLRSGICVVSADQQGDESRARADTVTQSFTVTGTSQTISFAQLGNTYLGEAAPALVRSSSSALPVTLVSNTPGVCEVAGGGLTLLMIGTCQLTASQPGNAIFEPATPVSRSFIVSFARSMQKRQLQRAAHAGGGRQRRADCQRRQRPRGQLRQPHPGHLREQRRLADRGETSIFTVSASQPGNASFRPANTVTQSVQIGGSQSGGGEDGDVPLPGWALASLAAALAGRVMRNRR